MLDNVTVASGAAHCGIDIDITMFGWLMAVTWLILPVVICLSQRLSHASLSMNDDTVKLRMAH